MRLSWRQGASACAVFLAVAVVQAWPLPRHLSTHLTGQPSGDTGVYVWNTWIFRQELIEHGRSPFFTSQVMALGDRTDLSLHNYTAFADLVAIPLQPIFGVVATFNLIYLLNITLAGFGAFLLAHRLTGRWAESMLAGVLFACSPFLVARSTGHFSLVAAAPLPFFLYWFDRAWESMQLRHAIAAGVTVAWAWGCDPYYAVYCVMLGGLVTAARLLSFSAGRRAAPSARQIRRVLDAACVALICLVVGVHFIAGGSLRIASISLSMRTLYTPMLVLTTLVAARLWLTVRPRFEIQPLPPIGPLARAAAAAVLAAMILLSPALIAVGRRVVEGRMPTVPVHWRSSAAGMDLLAFVLPNPNHPLAPASLARWLDSRPGWYIDNVASLSFVALAIIVIAWRAGFRPGRFWLALTLGFGVLALGPFVQVAGINTYIPAPWALLRYTPLIGAARMPSRFTVVALLGLAIIFAMALAYLGARRPQARRRLLAAAAVLLAFELLPVPRTLYSAEPPAIYQKIAADPRPIRVLELPTGIRDGVSSMGNFSASTQFFQTMHGKGLVGGYLSRVSERRKSAYRRLPVMSALMKLSEGKRLSWREEARARENVDQFMARANIGYVIMNDNRVSPELRAFAIDLFGLTKTAESGAFALYEPRPPR